jgi:hypothetical protein
LAQSNPYSYLTWLQAQQTLSLRLNDTAQVFWTKAETIAYLSEALRVWNAIAQPGTWIQDWSTSYTQPNPATLPAWQSTGNALNPLVGSNPTSPRTQTLTDSYVYTVAQMHLLEPPNGNATWTGTNQFSLADFTQALQRRRDTILQATACNVGPIAPISITPGTNRIELPDAASQSVLDLRRVRFIPGTGLGDPATLWRDDTLAMEYFHNDYGQDFGTPLTWDVIGSPPQFVTVDDLVSVPNTLDILAMLSGGLITPPTTSPLLMPDDWYWVLKFGMMADLLSKESESTDLQRAAYCEQRFQEGLKLMADLPWMTQAKINLVPCDTPSVTEADEYDNEWQSNPNAQIAIVRGGTDLFAVSPTITPGQTVQVTLSLIGNAPIPPTDEDFIQLSRDVLDVIIDEAQHLAAFKMGGSDFADTMPLHQKFLRAAVATNSRLADSGIFEMTLRPPVSRENEAQPRGEENASN